MNRNRFSTILISFLLLLLMILFVAILRTDRWKDVSEKLFGVKIRPQTPVMMQAPSSPGSEPGIVYKRVTFSELPPGINNDRRIKQFLGTHVAQQIIDPGRETNDSTIILDNDTVWQVIINPYPAETSGCSWYGEMQLNGSDDSDDTLTYGMFTYYFKLSSNWDWANGGKMIGLAGKDADGQFPPGGGVTGPDCNRLSDYETDDGFSLRGGFDFEDKWQSPGGEIGFYAYHQGFQYDDCMIHYGDTWNSRRTHDVDMTWEFDKWYKVTHRIVLNTPGQYNGILEWYRNDTCYVALNNVKFRNFDFITLDYFMLETFEGGDKMPGYKGAKVWYDDLVLWTDHDRSFHNRGYVMTYTPEMATPNVEN